MKQALASLVVISLILLPFTAGAEVPAQAIAFACKGCHSGSGSENKPSLKTLADLPANQIEKALLDFKYQRRTATLMNRIAKGYSDRELMAVAQFLGKP